MSSNSPDPKLHETGFLSVSRDSGAMSLANAIARISQTSTRLRLISYTALGSTLICVGLVLLFPEFDISEAAIRTASPLEVQSDLRHHQQVQLVAIGVACLTSLGLLAVAETQRKQGLVLFDEISNEIQSRVATTRDNADCADTWHKLAFDARFVLRDFSHAGDLPLVPGKWGAALYAAANVSLAAFAFIDASKGPRSMYEIFAGVYDRNASGMVVEDKAQEVSIIYTFVTPHEKTLFDLRKAGEALTPEETRYYTLDEGALERFANRLMSEGAQGFNYWECTGRGTKGEKRQYLWSVTWNRSRPISIEKLVSIYAEYFHRTSGIYIEERRVGKVIYSQ